ncbi:MAG: AAA family ATPase [Clostridium sp.]
MEKYFNTTGICVPELHYMVEPFNKIEKIETLINRRKYFVINRPRQFGKSTTINELEKKLNNEYLLISLSFEGIGDIIFNDERVFSKKFIELMADSIEFQNSESAKNLNNLGSNVENLSDLSKAITNFIKEYNKEVILIIDEVDKSSNNQLFLSFLGMLRNKYLLRDKGRDFTFKSVILAGVHDIKNLRVKIESNEEPKYNSPWNIAVDFVVDMSFSCNEIEKMLQGYCKDNSLKMDTNLLSDRIYFFSNGYPFLVSRICQIIDEDIYTKEKVAWTSKDIDITIKLLISEGNSLFQSIVKNLENNESLYDLVKRILLNGEIIDFNILDPIIELGVTYGIFNKGRNGTIISNKLFEEVIYNYMISKSRTSTKDMSAYNFKSNFVTSSNGLDIAEILRKFQLYMKENYSSEDEKFIEREGRLLFLAFITPIINGTGFAFKEVQISEEKRLDIVITYNNFKYIIELKIWRGEVAHKKGIKQLNDYLDINNLESGYLLIFNFNSNKEFKDEIIKVNDKDIFSIYV